MRKNLEKVYHRFAVWFRPLISPILTRLGQWSGKVQLGLTKPQVFAYRVIGEKTARFLPWFRDVDVNLRRSGIKINFKAYVSLTILTTLLVFLATLVTAFFSLLVVFRLSFLSSSLFGIGASLLAGASTLICFYIYPIYRSDNSKRNMEAELPFTTGYMAILAGAGVPPERMLRSLAQIDTSLAVSNEAKTITRDVELFGYDIISALVASSKRTPSEKFRGLLEGFIATIHSGGSLVKYFSERSRQYMKLEKIAMHRLSDTLGVLSEFYVTLLVAGPLMLVVMLAVMAMLGGGSGLFNPQMLLYLLTYLGIPLGSIIFLILIDAVFPRR
jgi:flagellar protein FlaJ